MTLAPLLANTAWAAGSYFAYAAFKHCLRDPGTVQRNLLFRYLLNNAETAFGLEHDLRGYDVDSFRKRVPIRDFDAFTPWVDGIVAGEANVLSAEPVTRLVPSSGTTRAAKLIPYTRVFQWELNRAIGPWIVDLFRRDPSLMAGPAYWSVTPVVPTKPQPSAVPIGYGDDAEYLGGWRRKLVASVMAVPGDVKLVSDVDEFRRAVARRLLDCTELRLISVWHPSFLELLLDTAESICGHSDWQRVWPHLNLVSCWADAHAAGPAAALQRRLPFVTLQPKGLLATEAVVSIPFAGQWPLAIRSHFFEFERDGQLYLADELESGGEYGVIVTTGAGLWRVRLGDAVHVDGFVDRTPSVRFIGRRDLVVDRFGEKLSEGFVGEAIRNWLAGIGIATRFAMLAPTDGRYTLFLESADALPPAADLALDAALSANPHYAYCRSLGQLAGVQIERVRDAYPRYTAARQRDGVRLGDIKPVAIDGRTDWAAVFEAG